MFRLLFFKPEKEDNFIRIIHVIYYLEKMDCLQHFVTYAETDSAIKK
jgi:hypothetical protein